MTDTKIARLSLGALFASLVFIGTFILKIPTPGTGGYIHPGDALVILSGVFLGPNYGFLAAAVGSALADILEATLSFYHEYHEYSYHLILGGFFTGFGYTVDSERETGYGRSDLIIRDPGRKRGMILELKHVEKEAEMEAALKEASEQMIVKKYDSRLDYEGYTTRLRYGMAFCDKKCLIGKV